MKENIEFLRELQKQMNYECEHNNDFQASPRFWVLKDRGTVPANEDYDEGYIQHFYNDGDFAAFDNFKELQNEVEEYHNYEIEDDTLIDIINSGSFELLWEYVLEHMNENGYYNTCYVKDEWFIVPNTMFITKEDAKKHIELNHYHYTDKVHTYAMTAWRSPSVEKLWDVLLNMDWNIVRLVDNNE